MYNGQTVGLGEIIWRVMQNKLVTDLTYDDAASSAIECIRLVGAPLIFENKVTRPPVDINEYKGLVPNDLINIRGIKLLSDRDIENISNFDSIEIPNVDVALRTSTDLYHNDIKCKDDNCNDIEYTYEIQKGIITTSFRKGKVIFSYKAIATDKEGYPLIPDNEKFKMALEYYILDRYLFNLWTLGKIPDKVYFKIEQRRLWYMGAANSDLQMPTIDNLESVMNSVNRILYNDNAHSQFFEKMGRKERIRKYH